MALDLLRGWNVRHLLSAWIAYWVALVILAVGSPALRVWRLTHDPASHGSATGSLNNDVISATVVQNGATVWAGSVHMVVLVLWLVGPPLALYLFWLRSRPSRPRDAVPILGAEGLAAIAVRPDGPARAGVTASAERGDSRTR